MKILRSRHETFSVTVNGVQHDVSLLPDEDHAGFFEGWVDDDVAAVLVAVPPVGDYCIVGGDPASETVEDDAASRVDTDDHYHALQHALAMEPNAPLSSPATQPQAVEQVVTPPAASPQAKQSGASEKAGADKEKRK